MQESELRELKAKEAKVHELGAGWFTLKDDTTLEALGKEVKEYTFDLGWNDFFYVTVHEHGAKLEYTTTGAIHYIKDINAAFQIARQMKTRNRQLSGYFFGEK